MAANLAILDIGLASNGCIQHHGDPFEAVWTREEVFHSGLYIIVQDSIEPKICISRRYFYPPRLRSGFRCDDTRANRVRWICRALRSTACCSKSSPGFRGSCGKPLSVAIPDGEFQRRLSDDSARVWCASEPGCGDGASGSGLDVPGLIFACIGSLERTALACRNILLT